jgi:hypothetical protein
MLPMGGFQWYALGLRQLMSHGGKPARPSIGMLHCVHPGMPERYPGGRYSWNASGGDSLNHRRGVPSDVRAQR